MKLTLKPTAAGYFKLRTFRVVDGVEVTTQETDWFHNIITDGGLEELGAVNSVNVLAQCQVGTGSTTPSAGDTALVSRVASVASSGSTNTAQASAPYYGSKTTTYRFGAGAAAGNIAELGISSVADNSRSLFSRALVLDGLGDPTTITVLSDEFLDVTYELRLYPPLTDVTGTVTLDGNDYDYTARAAEVTSATRWGLNIGSMVGAVGGAALDTRTGSIGAITSSPSGATLSGSPTLTNLSYSATSLERNMEGEWGLDDCNGTIGAIAVRTTAGEYQIGFSPGIPKTSTQVLTFVFVVSWARHDLP